jgi:hypothetical protein
VAVRLQGTCSDDQLHRLSYLRTPRASASAGSEENFQFKFIYLSLPGYCTFCMVEPVIHFVWGLVATRYRYTFCVVEPVIQFVWGLLVWGGRRVTVSLCHCRRIPYSTVLYIYTIPVQYPGTAVYQKMK